MAKRNTKTRQILTLKRATSRCSPRCLTSINFEVDLSIETLSSVDWVFMSWMWHRSCYPIWSRWLDFYSWITTSSLSWRLNTSGDLLMEWTDLTGLGDADTGLGDIWAEDDWASDLVSSFKLLPKVGGTLPGACAVAYSITLVGVRIGEGLPISSSSCESLIVLILSEGDLSADGANMLGFW